MKIKAADVETVRVEDLLNQDSVGISSEELDTDRSENTTLSESFLLTTSSFQTAELFVPETERHSREADNDAHQNLMSDESEFDSWQQLTKRVSIVYEKVILMSMTLMSMTLMSVI